MTPEESFKALSEPLKRTCANCVNFERKEPGGAYCETFMNDLCMPFSVDDDPRDGKMYKWNRKR